MPTVSLNMESTGGERSDVRKGGMNYGIKGMPVFKKGISFVCINARSLLPKMMEVKRMLDSSSASILAISETWLDANVRDEEVAVQGYSILRRDRNRHGGGVLLYIRDSLAFNRRQDLELEGIESVWAEILLPKSRGIFVGSMYRVSQKK